MSQRTTLSQLGTQLETALRTSTVTQGRVRYAAGQALVDFSEARAEQYPFTTLKRTNRDATWDSEQRLLAESLRINVSPDALSALVACLRQLLRNYIDKAADRIGHGFPIVGGSHGYTRALRSGLATRSYETPLSRFAESLVRASIAIGPERVVQLIEAWMDGGPLRIHTSAILSGVAVAEEITLPQGLAVRMLPRVSELLPLSVPRTTNLPVMDLLGAAVLTIDSTHRDRTGGRIRVRGAALAGARACGRFVWGRGSESATTRATRRRRRSRRSPSRGPSTSPRTR